MKQRLIEFGYDPSRPSISIVPEDSDYRWHMADPRKAGLVERARNYFEACPQSIPRIIHQIWIGPHPPPHRWLDSFRVAFREAFPWWTYKLWTEPEIATLELYNAQFYQQEEDWSGKADILRYELLYRYGGMYIDADSEWINGKALDDLLAGCNRTGMFAGREDDRMVAVGVIGASRRNPILAYLIHALAQTYPQNRLEAGFFPWMATGPVLFSEVIRDFDITVFPRTYFYPRSWHYDHRGIDVSQFQDSYMMQYGYSTNGFDSIDP